MLKFDEMDKYPVEFLIENTQIDVDKDFAQSVVDGIDCAIDYAYKTCDESQKYSMVADLFRAWLPLCILLKLRNYDYPYDSHTSKIMRTLLFEASIRFKGYYNIRFRGSHGTTDSIRVFSHTIKHYCMYVFSLPEEKFDTDFKSAKQVLNHHLKIFMDCACGINLANGYEGLLKTTLALLFSCAYSKDRYMKFCDDNSLEPELWDISYQIE